MPSRAVGRGASADAETAPRPLALGHRCPRSSSPRSRRSCSSTRREVGAAPRRLREATAEHPPCASARRRNGEEPRPGERRRRTSGPASAAAAPGGVELITEPQRIKGSTRLEAKKQRRRDGREAGRRRAVVTEAEFLARREAVDRVMIVRSKNGRIQIAVLEDSVLVEHYVARNQDASLIGNVYLGRVQNVLPSMEAAFVDIGRGRNAVLYSGEVDWDAVETGNQPRRIELALKSRRPRARAGHEGPGRPQGRPPDEPDLAARPLPRLRARTAR